MPADKRKFVRVNYPCSVTVHSDSIFEVIMANTANISAGGLCVFLNQPITLGKVLNLRIENFFEGNPLTCSGQVERCQEDEAPTASRQKFYEVGIAFISIDDKQRQYLEGFVQRLLALAGKNH